MSPRRTPNPTRRRNSSSTRSSALQKGRREVGLQLAARRLLQLHYYYYFFFLLIETGIDLLAASLACQVLAYVSFAVMCWLAYQLTGFVSLS